MHYEINYNDLEPEVKRLKAIADIKDYMGEAKYYILTEQFKGMSLTLEQFQLYASLAGIQGYPALAWWHTVYPDHD